MTLKRILMLLIAMSITPAQAADPVTAPGSTWQNQDQVIEQFRADISASPTELLAEGLVLSSGEAARFWPMFEAFQKEQKAITEEQLKSVLQYRDVYKKLTDDDALDYVNSILKRDQKLLDLRVKYLARFQEVVSPRIAARAIQLDRRLGLAGQMRFASQVPLIP
ncbi:MAG TPA: hypothetical protein VF720_15740 [Candidatus Eisenbacteria bacterium]